MSNLVKNLLIALGITIILALAYFFFLKDEDIDVEGGLGFASANSVASIEIERILADTQKINSYDVAGHSSVLTDSRFTSLLDRRIDIPEVGTGRENPFAPVQ